MQTSDIERIFFELLASLAVLAGKDIDKEMIGFYDKQLSPYGYDRVNKALKIMLHDMRPGDRLPSIADIKKRMDDGLTTETKTQGELAHLLKLIGDKGYVWDQTCRYDGFYSFDHCLAANFSPALVEVIRRFGGWRKLCEFVSEAKNPIAVRAQLREAIGSLIEREEKTGGVGSSTLPEAKTHQTIAMLADKFDITKRGKPV